ncbi:MAG: SH3 domain-containing protein [Clostridiales bacterium]|nr:SH3 domain-containing protein [Clostridiales bacterium]
MNKRPIQGIVLCLFLLCLPFMISSAASHDDTLMDDFGQSLGQQFIEGELFGNSYYDSGSSALPDETESEAAPEEGTGDDSETDLTDAAETESESEAVQTDFIEVESETEGSQTEAVLIETELPEEETEAETEMPEESESEREIVSVIASGDSYFEREVAGSTGWSTASLTLHAEASSSAASVGSLSAGTAFRIVSESGDWWQVTLSDGTTGYVEHSYCMINLPDVLPEMEYAITNAYYSIYVSSGYEIPGVTGTKLYSAGTSETEGRVWNERLGRYEYLVPVMYSAAKKISIAQYNAYNLTNGQFTLKIYDSYRPHSVTTKIASALTSLYNSNSTVQKNIDYSTEPSGATYSWGYSWFLAQSLSTHNTGSAIDVTLCEYNTESASWRELDMPTDVHELSSAAIKYYSGSVSKSPSNYSGMMNANAKLLDYIFIGGSYNGYTFQSTGMDTLASEWWHFQDNDTHRRVRSYASSGCDFQVTECLSM